MTSTTPGTRTSPLLALPGAVGGDGIDAGVAAHYGSFNTEQRTLERGDGFVDLSHRDVLRIAGPDRLTWLHALTSQHFATLAPKVWTGALVLSPNGHVEHAFYGYDDGEAFTAHTEPGQAAALIEFLERMKFMMRVEVSDVTDELAVTWRPRPDADAANPYAGYEFVPRDRLVEYAEAAGLIAFLERMKFMTRAEVSDVSDELAVTWRPSAAAADAGPYDAYELVPRDRLREYADAAGPACGFWAFEALRIARGEPRLGIDTDHRTIPNEAGWIGPAVHLDKGCYRGQETVARVHTLGRPPRRLTLLHLDGSENRLPTRGADVRHGDKVVGFVGSSARHHELGPIALAMVKRNVPLEAVLEVDDMPAGQEMLVDPEVGLHVRPLR